MLKVHDQAASMVGCQNLVGDMLLAHTQLACLVTDSSLGGVGKERERQREAGGKGERSFPVLIRP